MSEAEHGPRDENEHEHAEDHGHEQSEVRGSDDRALPFQVDKLEVRGRTVTLGASIDTILNRHDFPLPVKKLMAEAAVLASLISTSLKDFGRFILQTQTDGPVSMIVVDIRMPGQIRATASFDAEAVSAAVADGKADAVSLLGQGTLAMTVEQGHSSQRYQGFVPLQSETLEEAAHTYFRQSEQIPTRIRIAVAEMFDRDEEGAPRHSWRAGGIIAQFLPYSEDRLRRRDLPGGDVPETAEPMHEHPDDDAWVEASALVDTVEDHELTDPEVSAETLLYRLFHESGVRVFEPIYLEERCSCSRERISRVLLQLGPEELDGAAAEGDIKVRCEFCGTEYRFERDEFPATIPEPASGS